MPIVRPDGVDAKRETLDDVVDEVDRVRLGVLLVDAQGADARGVVDRRVLEAPYLAALGILEMQELHVDLDVVARGPASGSACSAASVCGSSSAGG
jgi:hypothetical protein